MADPYDDEMSFRSCLSINCDCISRGISFLRQKIIQHAVQTSDWPPPEVIFGSKSTSSPTKAPILPPPPSSSSIASGHRHRSSNRNSFDRIDQSSSSSVSAANVACPPKSALVNSRHNKRSEYKSSIPTDDCELNTIVSGFKEFEQSFNRYSLSQLKASSRSPNVATKVTVTPKVKFKEPGKILSNRNDDYHDEESSHSDVGSVDPLLLGLAIEKCLKERTKN